MVDDLAELSAAESATLSLHPVPVDLAKPARAAPTSTSSATRVILAA